MVQEMSCSIDIAYVAHLHLLFRFETEQWRIQGRAPPPLFVDQTEAQRAEKQFFETAPAPHTPYLKVWIRQRSASNSLTNVRQVKTSIQTSYSHPKFVRLENTPAPRSTMLLKLSSL